MSRGNVENLHPKVSPGALRIIDAIEQADHLQPILDRDYLIKGWLDRGAISVVYGDANVGKSFFAIDIAHHVQEGLEWAGRRVRSGQVLYIAAEGGSGLNNRLVARQARFMVLRAPVTLADPAQKNRNTDGQALAEAVERMTARHGRFSLIVIDTMARVMGGANENEAPAIAALMANLELIRDRTGAHIMLIHHTGKDTSRGARGHSSLRASVDTEIELTKGDMGLIGARTTKQRDMMGGCEIEFSLRIETLGQDSDGDHVTSCTIQHHTKQRGTA